MLEKPNAGWTHIMFGSQYLGTASYITDVPIDCLNRMITYLSKKEGTCNFSIEFDAEGYIFGMIEFDGSLYHVLDTTGCPILKKLNPESIGMTKNSTVDEIIKQLAAELLNDIQENEMAWLWWDCLDEETAEIEERKEKIQRLLAKLRDLI